MQAPMCRNQGTGQLERLRRGPDARSNPQESSALGFLKSGREADRGGGLRKRPCMYGRFQPGRKGNTIGIVTIAIAQQSRSSGMPMRKKSVNR